MTLQKARALLQRARGACMDEKHVKADSLIEEALREMEGMTTEEKIEEFRKELEEAHSNTGTTVTCHLKYAFNTLFPPPEPRKAWMFFYEWYDDTCDKWKSMYSSSRSRAEIEENYNNRINSVSFRNVSRIIEVVE